MKKSFKLVALTTGLLVYALTSDASANLVSDGNFNTPSGGSSFTTYYSGSSFGGWNVTSGSVDLIGGYWQAPTVGGGSVDIDGSSVGAISQSLALNAGSYVLTFSLSGNPQGSPSTKLLDVSVGNIVNELFTYTIGTNTTTNMQYATETVDFTTTGHTNLVFASADPANPGEFGAVIGDVSVNSVSSVPLPAGLPMFAVALLGLFGFHSFRKRQQLA